MSRIAQIALLIVFVVSALMGGRDLAWAREVDSREDLLRLQGWDEHQKRMREFDRQRLTDRDDVAKRRDAWEREKRDDLVEYRAWKKKQTAALDESGPEYREYLKAEAAEARRREELREDFIEKRNDIRRKFSATVDVTEKQELGIAEDPERVDWHKRDLLSPKGRASGSRAGGSGNSRPSFTPPSNRGNDFIPPEFDTPPPPPPTTPPPPDFFEPDIPPPPPPPPPDEGFDVPPPPPAIEEGAPPPIFDDEF